VAGDGMTIQYWSCVTVSQTWNATKTENFDVGVFAFQRIQIDPSLGVCPIVTCPVNCMGIVHCPVIGICVIN
jgi:hypothetical protein